MTESLAIPVEALPSLPQAVPVPADRHPVPCYLGSLESEASRRTMRQALERIADILTGGKLDALAFPWSELRAQHTSFIKGALQVRFAIRTANKMLAALKGVLKWSWRLGYMTEEERARACDFKGVKGTPPPTGRALTDGELLSLFRACADAGGPGGARDAALLGVLAGCGLRRFEVVALNLEHYTSEARHNADHGTLNVTKGKGAKHRNVPISNGAKAALDDWIAIRGEEPGPLVKPVRKGGEIQDRRMSTQAVYEALRRRSVAAGVEQFSPHDLRRTYITGLLEAEADVLAVKDLAGHASVATTGGYDKRGEKKKHKAACLVRLPYVRAWKVQ